MGKMSECQFQLEPRTQPWIYLWWGLLSELWDLVSGKKQRQMDTAKQKPFNICRMA